MARRRKQPQKEMSAAPEPVATQLIDEASLGGGRRRHSDAALPSPRRRRSRSVGTTATWWCVARIRRRTYFLSDHTHTREAPEGWRFSKLQEQWLYDEVDLMNDHRGPFLHRILLSTGITLEVPFMSVVIHRFTMPAGTQLAQQIADTHQKKIAGGL